MLAAQMSGGNWAQGGWGNIFTVRRKVATDNIVRVCLNHHHMLACISPYKNQTAAVEYRGLSTHQIQSVPSLIRGTDCNGGHGKEDLDERGGGGQEVKGCG